MVLSFGTEVLSVWTPTAKQIENNRRAWMVAWAVAYSMCRLDLKHEREAELLEVALEVSVREQWRSAWAGATPAVADRMGHCTRKQDSRRQ